MRERKLNQQQCKGATQEIGRHEGAAEHPAAVASLLPSRLDELTDWDRGDRHQLGFERSARLDPVGRKLMRRARRRHPDPGRQQAKRPVAAAERFQLLVHYSPLSTQKKRGYGPRSQVWASLDKAPERPKTGSRNSAPQATVGVDGTKWTAASSRPTKRLDRRSGPAGARSSSVSRDAPGTSSIP